ncbi:malate dehydrogenase [Rothia sp. AR01]|uniref:Malate dehydrogenase n=1 Tax=Rothia santali TaxID=2949643 RepID=A0A9X2KI29_9MICC|nr:malate dehydrogenase [Rothia santali]MCP3425560.1 malate dehydrogenase [Rothia santali]
MTTTPQDPHQTPASGSALPAATDPVTVTVTGAAGNIGYATLFRVAAGEMLGADRPVRLRLLEIPSSLEAAEGTALELQDGAFPLLESVDVFDDPVRAFDGVQAGLLIGSRPRGPGMERSELLEANGAIFSAQGAAINAGAAEDVRVVVVGNPANTNALIAASHAPDVPLERFTALTRLDHHRAVAQLALATGSPVGSVRRVSIWGNHSASQVPDVDHAEIGGRPALEVLAEHGRGRAWIDEEFIPRVARRGAEIIEVRGGSSVASAAHAAICHMRDWVRGTPEGDWTSMAVPSDGSHGVQEGLISSFPVTCAAGRYDINHEVKLGDDVENRLRASVRELAEEREAVRSRGLLGPRGRSS